MSVNVLFKAALGVAVLAFASMSTGSTDNPLTKKKIYDACIPVETEIALSGSETKAPKNRRDAAAYAHFICSVTSELCTKDPSSEPCQKSLKDYGLTK